MRLFRVYLFWTHPQYVLEVVATSGRHALTRTLEAFNLSDKVLIPLKVSEKDLHAKKGLDGKMVLDIEHWSVGIGNHARVEERILN
jgi:hypothetical protein